MIGILFDLQPIITISTFIMHVSQFMLLGLLAVFAAVAKGQALPRVLHLRHSRHGLAHAREVVVETQCRCNPNRCFSKGETQAVMATNVTQPASLATGPPKTFSKAVRPCSCSDGQCNVGLGDTFRKLETRYSSTGSREARAGTPWAEIPDFGNERDLPVFVGALSFMSSLSLGAGLQNWKETFFSPQVASQFKGFYVHLNNRSRADDAVVEPFARHLRDMGLPIAITGGVSNDNVGKVIADQCRLAEQSEHSHPRGENVLLWLEKDWHWNVGGHGLDVLNDKIDSARELLQRGVVKLNMRIPHQWPSRPNITWPCRGQNVTWWCSPGFVFFNMNSPMLIRCDWHLRYFEPYALFTEPVMMAYGRTGKKRAYVDWEDAGADGRIEWINSNWILGASQERDLFRHVELNETDMYKR